MIVIGDNFMKTQIVAHRGARKYAPENTLASIRKALLFNEVDVLEIDVHLTKDNQLVIIHDEKIDRTTDGYGYVEDFTLNELQMFDAGSWFDTKFSNETIPSMQEVLNLLNEMNFSKTLLIEVKTDHIEYANIEKILLDNKMLMTAKFNVIFQSFNLKTLERLYQLNHNVELNALVYMPNYKALMLLKKGIIQAINPDNKWPINRIYWLKKKQISPWTVNKAPKMRVVFKAHLKRVITDEIELAIKLRKEIQS